MLIFPLTQSLLIYTIYMPYGQWETQKSKKDKEIHKISDKALDKRGRTFEIFTSPTSLISTLCISCIISIYRFCQVHLADAFLPSETETANILEILQKAICAELYQSLALSLIFPSCVNEILTSILELSHHCLGLQFPEEWGNQAVHSPLLLLFSLTIQMMSWEWKFHLVLKTKVNAY